MAVRDYSVCTAASVAAIQSHVERCLQAWSDAWLHSELHSQLRCECRVFEGVQPKGGAAWHESCGNWGYVWAEEGGTSVLSSLLFAARKQPAHSIAEDVAHESLAVLCQLLAGTQEPSVRVAALPTRASQAGRQTIHVYVSMHEWTFAAIVQPHVAQGLPLKPNSSAPLGSLQAALAAQRIRLEVSLGEAEISLGALQALGVGDIVRFERRIDQPAELNLLGQKLPCAAFLGTLDGRAAVELAR